MTAFLSKSWVNSVSWESTISLKGSTKSLALGMPHATGHTAQQSIPNCSQNPGIFVHPGEKAGEGIDTSSVFLRIQTGIEILQDLPNK